MKFGAAIALLAFAMPAFAQHGGARAGSFGTRGFAGRAGFSSPGSGSFARPSPAFRYSASGNAGFRQMSPRAIGPQTFSGFRAPYSANRFAAGRSAYDARFASVPPSSARSPYFHGAAAPYRSSDRDRFDARRRQFQNWYVNTYPYWPGYPYLYDPNAYNLGLYDWSDSGGSAAGSYLPGNSSDDQNGSAPLYLGPYPDQGYAAPGSPAGAAPPAASEQPLTVIFRSGRAPIKVRNYLMTSSVLTDLDSDHYEQIPLSQIDLAATESINQAAGLDFQVPGPARD